LKEKFEKGGGEEGGKCERKRKKGERKIEHGKGPSH
jgi:hypothetical protein